MSRDARTIKETGEAVQAIVVAFHAWQTAKSDGHVSFKEWIRMAGLIPLMWEALDGAGSIPKELRDIDGLEADELIAMCASSINAQIDTPAMRRKIDKLLVLFHAAVDAEAEWRGVNPPRAEIVP